MRSSFSLRVISPFSSALTCPIHEISSSLIRAKEENLLALQEIDHVFSWEEDVKKRVDVLLERHSSLVLMGDVEKDRSLGTALGDVLFLISEIIQLLPRL